MNHKAEVKVKELKMVRGFSISPRNLMALREESFEQTIATEDGGTVSVSAVMDQVLTEWREKREAAKAVKVKKP